MAYRLESDAGALMELAAQSMLGIDVFSQEILAKTFESHNAEEPWLIGDSEALRSELHITSSYPGIAMRGLRTQLRGDKA